MKTDSPIGQRWDVMVDALDERQRRLLVGVEAKVLGGGGISAVALATGVSCTTIVAGISEIETMKPVDLAAPATNQLSTPKTTGARQAGGGCKKSEVKDETLLPNLLSLVDSTTRGNPESQLRLTCKSLRNLADELEAKGHDQSPDRNAQFAPSSTTRTSPSLSNTFPPWVNHPSDLPTEFFV